ncbi:STAS domain-containing protein [Nonomuraea turcica]|uniref:STAS domain-containing protein n=1 Tax=Nonomuraea sp. G32 TaxID=3067274 RepID=UPI00273B4E0C|nr:STAS domain-containing protein [Nonomuraea sp. G32]MDP4511540.1 STAS domain-containing protein [Nonomuraea sp. G32]
MRHSHVCPVIGLQGELRAITVGDFFEQMGRILADRPDVVVIDLSRLEFCDFDGVAALVGAYRRARQLGAEVVLAGPHGRCAQVLHRTGLDHIFLGQGAGRVPAGMADH